MVRPITHGECPKCGLYYPEMSFDPYTGECENCKPEKHYGTVILFLVLVFLIAWFC